MQLSQNTFLNLKYLMTEDTSLGSQSSKLNMLLFLHLQELRFIRLKEELNFHFFLKEPVVDEHLDNLPSSGCNLSSFDGMFVKLEAELSLFRFS